MLSSKCDQRMTSQCVTSEHGALEFGRLMEMDKLIFKYERIAVTKLYFVYWFVSYDRLHCETNGDITSVRSL